MDEHLAGEEEEEEEEAGEVQSEGDAKSCCVA
jgi:hypothetical protein